MVGALALLFPVLVAVSLSVQSHGSPVYFSFPSFNSSSDQLMYMGNASFSPSHGYIDLTPSPNGTSVENCIGRVLYGQPITVWPATFTTTFTFLISNITANYGGDGLAFIIVPNNKPFLADSIGGYLGLFDGSTSGNTTNQLAIEFDTYKNYMIDPDDNHVGIDLKSIRSDATANLDQYGINLKSGRRIRVRIDYDGRNKNLQIYATYADGLTSYASILNRTIDLSKTVLRSAYVGFSAATGNVFEIHSIFDWSFSSVSLPESPLNKWHLPRKALVLIIIVAVDFVGASVGLLVLFVRKIWNGRRGAGESSGGLS